MKNLYFSNSAYGGLHIKEALETITQAGINQIELSVGTKVDENTPALLSGYSKAGVQFLIHHNSPINGKSNFVNLCDRVPEEYFRQVFEFCNLTGTTHYSIHGGNYSRDSVSKASAFENYCARFAEADKIAQEYNIKLAVETMYPTISGNQHVLADMQEIEFFQSIFPDAGMVLDCAHIKIQKHYGTADDSIIRWLLDNPNLVEIHISENDGRSDRHTPVLKNSWFWGAIKERPNVPVVIEGKLNKLGSEAIRENYDMVGEMLS